jgi:hypothetical protein
VTVSFVGSEVEYVGEMNDDLGDIEIYLDGNQVSTMSGHTRGDPQAHQILYRSSPLNYGQHWLKLVKHSGRYLFVDGSVVHEVANQNDPRVQYAGAGWRFSGGLCLGDYGDDLEYTRTNGDSVTLYFSGSDATILGELGADFGSLSVRVDGISWPDVSEYAGERKARRSIRDLRGLALARHTVTLVKRSGTYIALDGIETHEQ